MDEERSTELEISLGDLLGILRQCWIIMLAALIVVGVAVYAFLNATHVDEYTAEAIIHVGNTGGGSSNASASQSDLNVAKDLIEDCKYVVKDRETVNAVIHSMGLIINDRQAFLSDIEVTSKTGTRFVVVSVTAKNAERAADIATELAKETCSTLNGYYSTDDASEDKKIFKIHSEGETPEEISNPVSKLKVLLIAFAAAIVVYVVYLLLFILDDKINGPEDVERYLDLSILGQIPNKQDAGRRRKMYAYDASSK